MPDYEKMYHLLFNAITDALRLIDERSLAAKILKRAQCACEERYLESAE